MNKMFGTISPLVEVDQVDGLRMIFGHGEVIHLRESGNAPEFRCYVEASTAEQSRKLLGFALERMREFLG
jgi:phosphomannomutase